MDNPQGSPVQRIGAPDAQSAMGSFKMQTFSLRKADVSSANLRRGNLRRADLRGTNLTRADLDGEGSRRRSYHKNCGDVAG